MAVINSLSVLESLNAIEEYATKIRTGWVDDENVMYGGSVYEAATWIVHLVIEAKKELGLYDNS